MRRSSRSAVSTYTRGSAARRSAPGLHGAGGNRGFTRWTRAVAERFPCGSPTHPGFGRSGDASGWKASTTRAFYIWFIDAMKLGRPHLLGQSLGGWTAAEMSPMNPGAVDRLILAAPVGLKPEKGEITDIFFHSRGRASRAERARPKPIRNGTSSSASRRLQPSSSSPSAVARCPRLPGSRTCTTRGSTASCARDEPGAHRVGPRRQHRSVECGERTVARCRTRTLTVLDKCGHLIRSSSRRRSRGSCSTFFGEGRTGSQGMKLYYFSEMPHHEYPDAEGEKYPSLRLAFPNGSSTARRPSRTTSAI